MNQIKLLNQILNDNGIEQALDKCKHLITNKNIRDTKQGLTIKEKAEYKELLIWKRTFNLKEII